MILEVALGVALGLLIYANIRGLIAMSLLAVLFVLLLFFLGVATWILYTAFDATRSFLPLLRLSGQAAEISGLIFGVLANILFALVCGQVLGQRSSLSKREAAVFGVFFYSLFLFTAISLPIAVSASNEGQTKSAILYLLTMVSVWTLVVRQCLLRNKRRKQQVKV
jgi:hypothetical protein